MYLLSLLGFVIVSWLGFEYDRGFIRMNFLPESMHWIKISSYGVFLALSFVAANIFIHKEVKRLGLDTSIADNYVIISIVFGIIGSKIFFVFETWGEWHGFSGMLGRLFSGAGLTWYGGLLLVIAMLMVYSRYLKMPYGQFLNIGVAPLAIGYAVGRLGCIASGDGCYGVKCPYDWPAPFAMSFPNGVHPWSLIVNKYGDPNVIVYNTPLFESLFSLGVFLYLWFIAPKEWPAGLKLVFYLFLHAIFRFFIEFIRLNSKDFWGLTQAQIVSLAIMVFVCAFVTIRREEVEKFIRS